MNNVGKTVRFGKMDWTILDRNADGCLLLANRCIDVCVWDTSEPPLEWEESELCRYLKTEYMDKIFSDEEQACLNFNQLNCIFFWNNSYNL